MKCDDSAGGKFKEATSAIKTGDVFAQTQARYFGALRKANFRKDADGSYCSGNTVDAETKLWTQYEYLNDKSAPLVRAVTDPSKKDTCYLLAPTQTGSLC